MSQENSQFDIPGIQLRESRTQPKVSLSREIGDAQIIHTIFGRAKVRIIRKHDQARRNMMMIALVVAGVAIAAAAWQGWFSSPQTETAQSAGLVPAVSGEAQAGTPDSKPENTIPPAAPLLVNSEAVAPPPTEISDRAVSQNTMPQQPGGLADAKQMAAKPIKVKPKPRRAIDSKPVMPEPAASKPQAASVTTNNAMKNQTDKPLPANPPPTRGTVTPATATPPAAQPAAGTPPDASLNNEDSTRSPVDDKQLSAPINLQGK